MSVKKSKISVIIPAYNAENEIQATLQSIADQTLQPLEILVVDDASTDNTWQLLQSYNGKVGNIPLHLFQQENAGAGAARNKAISKAKGEYLAFLDADDAWLPEKLAESLKQITAHTVDFIAHDIINVFVETGEEQEIHCAARFQNALKNPWDDMFFKNYIAISTVVARTEKVKKAGCFEDTRRYSLDFDLWQKMLKNGCTYHVFSAPLTRYAVRLGALSTKVLPRLDDRMAYIQKYSTFAAKRLGKSHLNVALYATLIIHYEALLAAKNKGSVGDSIKVLCLLPINLFKATKKE